MPFSKMPNSSDADDGAERVSRNSSLPYYIRGEVVPGYKRGGSELGFLTANLPYDVVERAKDCILPGIYFGWASVGLSSEVYPMVMSFGWNPQYGNKRASLEVHVIHDFNRDFYHEEIRAVAVGWIRDEACFGSLDELKERIKQDIKEALEALKEIKYTSLENRSFLEDPKPIPGPE